MNDLIFDGNSLYARCWFGVKSDPVKAVQVFIQSVLQFLDQSEGKFGVPISRTLFAWDGAAKTAKKHTEKPEGYMETRYDCQKILMTLFGTVHGWHPDYEADDVVATAAFNSKADTVFVVSGDKDLMQLQGGNVSYYDLNSKSIMRSLSICRKFNVKRPSQVALYLAIVGDPGDGIKGIPRWGPKKAEKLFEAVTEGMNFSQAMEAIQAQIPPHLVADFMESLDMTLLHTDVPGLEDPAPLTFCSGKEVRDLRIAEIAQSYERVATQYEGGSGDEALEDLLKRGKDSSEK